MQIQTPSFLSYVQKRSNRYSQWPRAEKIWEETNDNI